jgi:transcriptional regulator with XRE-family HTH domain
VREHHRLLRFLGPALRLMRLRRGMRQCDLAGRARVTKAMLSAYERSRRLPSLRTLSKLLDARDARLLDLGVASNESSSGRGSTTGGGFGSPRTPLSGLLEQSDLAPR